jgi:hypothetical protein
MKTLDNPHKEACRGGRARSDLPALSLAKYTEWKPRYFTGSNDSWTDRAAEDASTRRSHI